MIEQVALVEELRALARSKIRDYVYASVSPSQVETHVSAGWEITKVNKTNTRLRRAKFGHELLVDRVWSLLYRLGVLGLSKDSATDTKDDGRGAFDLIAFDSEINLAIACVAKVAFGRSKEVDERMLMLVDGREHFARSMSRSFPSEHKRNNVLCMFVENIDLSDDQLKAAEQRGVTVFDESDLAYYEKLADHLGAAAKYQLYADLLPGKAVPGLSIRVPAVRTRMGSQTCYTFPISPEYLLKIAYVSHRAKGKASDVHTYQRMLKKGRLSKIREYISDRGVFPTNIVLNIDKKYLRFERVNQETTKDATEASGLLGWLSIKPAYKSAWIIDGQHRLFAYSGHEYARTGHLSVLAFEGISASAQAKLFVDINAKQKSVKPSLLQELFAELHWDSESPSIRVQAIISKAVQSLDSDRDSPFFARIQTADAAKDPVRCISLASMFRALEKHQFFIEREEHNEVSLPGPFWAGSGEKTLSRTNTVLKRWFGAITRDASDWWELGSLPGGGLAMNDSVVACINVLWSVLDHLRRSQVQPLSRIEPARLADMLMPYANAVGAHFARMTADERKRYRDLRGSQGQTVRTRRAQQAIAASIPAFCPPGLDDFLAREKAQTNLRGKEIIDRLEILIQRIVTDELKQEFGADDSGWWTNGVPKQIRTAVVGRQESDDNKRQAKEAYFELSEYRSIVTGQWVLFQGLMGIGRKSESKDKQTKWLVDLNEMRRIVAHSSSGVTLTIEQLDELERIEAELLAKQRMVAGSSDVEDLEEDESVA